jgi:hypothetical protein
MGSVEWHVIRADCAFKGLVLKLNVGEVIFLPLL